MKPSRKSKVEQRHYNMSRIHSKDTAPEILLRKALWKEGIRYRKNYKMLPGTPDIAITKNRIAIFCDGEFWHGKDWSEKKKRIQKNREYWIPKIERNIKRDIDVQNQLRYLGWYVIRFWGNDIKKDVALCVNEIKEAMIYAEWENLI
jgi:DNA mismatch endonuclease (patch repair protein)